jgi:hypothetical protein
MKAEAIIKKIIELANEGRVIRFEEDMGGNSLTIYIDELHTHVGCPESRFDVLLDNLYDSLTEGPGLSWA